MKLHQVLTGACNAGDRCFAVGSVEGIPFVTYAAGSNIVILSVTFERVQIIPGICHQNVQISCIDCSTDTGKIAAAYGNKVKIFEPTPLVHHNSAHVRNVCFHYCSSLNMFLCFDYRNWTITG